jgi:plastocyanin
MHTLTHLLPVLLLLAGAAHAAGVTVLVSDEAGQPLADAVVMLEPVGGKLPVKPMAPVDIGQSKRQFDPQLTVVTVGTPVNFPNFDTVRHHVYSFSPIKTFELKLYAGVPGKPVVFDKPGEAVLGCNIHDRMAAWVVVAETPWFAQSGSDGSARIADAPAGAYRLSVWHPGLAANTPPLTKTLQIGTAEIREALKLPVEALP